MTVLLEICIDSIASAKAAKRGGADRLEVCSALALGGTTPSFGLLEQCVTDLQMPSMMMIRPHDGNFVYDADHLETMLTDIEVAKSTGAQGVVFGCLTAEGEIDLESCQRLIDACDGLETTFHRAFDVVPNPLEAFRQLQEIGFDRLLTSGQQPSALEGASLIRQLVDESTTTTILAGAGVSAATVEDLVRQTGVCEVHASASIAVDAAQSGAQVSFGAARRETDETLVASIKHRLGP